MSIDSTEKRQIRADDPGSNISAAEIFKGSRLGDLSGSDPTSLPKLPGLEIVDQSKGQQVAQFNVMQPLSESVGVIKTERGLSALFDTTQKPPKPLAVIGADGKPIWRPEK